MIPPIRRIWGLPVLVMALLQACASQQPLPPEPQPQPQPPAQAEAVAPAAKPAAVAAPSKPKPKPKPVAAKPVPPMDAASLPPFEGGREVVIEPLPAVKMIDTTVPVEDIWQRIRRGFAMPDLDDKLTRRNTAIYAREHDYLQRMFDRSRMYLYHIVEEIEKRGLPTELALLPMVESAFNPMAYSRAHASGLWQFIPGTGRRFDLKQNWWYDGRRDVVDSTSAALDYLTKLYEMHGDWHLALASYNWGENAVKRAVARNKKARKPTDYASLRMPRETRNYVPKLQALKNIIANPEPYGIDLDPIPNEPYFVLVSELPDIDVALAAQLAEMPVKDFVALNPGFSRPLIRSEAARIILPADKVGVFHENLAKHDQDALVSWQVYRPKRGETLGSISKKFQLPIDQLKRVNGIAPRSWSVPKVLVVPLDAQAKKEAGTLPIMYSAPIPTVRHVHRVKRGDTLSSIAARYRVRVSDLKAWNRIGRYLQIGQRIQIR
ncbi:MAG TPA: transglycosylase SLT domain-containing protein [Burkholderiales bacterium]|nr:transglycosylase SLT domain-containing protein [Burkholderiales bacterium]